MTRILVIDNYDSFVFTLVGYIQQLGAETTVIRNDEYELDEVIKLAEEHDGVLVSPGPVPRRGRRHHRHHPLGRGSEEAAAGRLPGPPGYC